MDGSSHERLTGVSNKRILSNFTLVAESGVEVIVRIPVIPGLNDSKENITAMAKFLASFKSVKEVNLLPYHRFGVGKYEMLDRPYLMSAEALQNKQHIEELKDLIVASGFVCKIID